MAKESVLTLEEKQSIKIDKLIFHIIIEAEEIPHYLDEITISEEQLNFFRDRLIDISQGTQYIFIDKEHNSTYALAQEIIEDPENKFLDISRQLTASFKRMHSKNTSDGVFITAIVTVKDSRKLVFLVKLDHKKVFKYELKGKKALLEEVKNTFIEDKTAVQKVALIDVSKYYLWDVLAYDRAKPAGLTKYFRDFLSVNPRETASHLTQYAMSYTNRWATANRTIIDPEQEPSTYKKRAIDYLSTQDTFDSDKFIDFVIVDPDKKRRKELKKSFKDFLDENGLSGQRFKPVTSVINKSSKKNIRQTAEGVRIEWVGDAKDANVFIQPPSEEGLYKISIITNQLTNIQ